MTPIMTPSVGRIVHYWPNAEHGKTANQPGVRARKGQPYPAVITHVWSDTCVNLRVIDDGSHSLGSGTSMPTVTSCVLADAASPPDGEFWSWPARV